MQKRRSYHLNTSLKCARERPHLIIASFTMDNVRVQLRSSSMTIRNTNVSRSNCILILRSFLLNFAEQGTKCDAYVRCVAELMI